VAFEEETEIWNPGVGEHLAPFAEVRAVVVVQIPDRECPDAVDEGFHQQDSGFAPVGVATGQLAGEVV
jgi:hypothetical protein